MIPSSLPSRRASGILRPIHAAKVFFIAMKKTVMPLTMVGGFRSFDDEPHIRPASSVEAEL
jgi:hypothetical protein